MAVALLQRSKIKIIYFNKHLNFIMYTHIHKFYIFSSNNKSNNQLSQKNIFLDKLSLIL